VVRTLLDQGSTQMLQVCRDSAATISAFSCLLPLLHPHSSHNNKTRRRNDINSQNDKTCNPQSTGV
jgi:hypothetical protein